MTSDTSSPTLHDLRDIVAEVLELQPEEITDNSDLIDENEADSLLLIEIVARIEKRYGIEIAQESVADMRTLQDIHRIASDHLHSDIDAS
jgi:acyl carrier protein